MVARLRRDMDNPDLRKIALDRYRMVRRIEVKLKTHLSYFHGSGNYAIFPAGTASVVYWLVYEDLGTGVHSINDSFIQRFRLVNGKLLASKRAQIRLTEISFDGRATDIVDFLKGQNFEFTSGKERRLFRRMSSGVAFVEYTNDPTNGFLGVYTGNAGDSYETVIDPFTNRSTTDHQFLQKYGLPTAEVDSKASAAAHRLSGGVRRKR